MFEPTEEVPDDPIPVYVPEGASEEEIYFIVMEYAGNYLLECENQSDESSPS